jgi:arylsulfatase A-like enzyme
MVNNITHIGALLEAPAYTPAEIVDNTQYEADYAHLRTYNGKTLRLNTRTQMMHYHSNMAAMLQLGKWFDFLRENGVYDNTRIILVSDHAYSLYHHDEMVMDGGADIQMDLEYYCPLLMVKDFGSTGFSVCDDFMTNADVPTLAMDGVIENPVNPFTGNPVNSDQKIAHDQLVLLSQKFDLERNNGNTFLPDRWASVKDDVWNVDNWTVYDKETVLTEHQLPAED